MAESDPNPYLRRPLYAFDLPPELLYSLTVKTTGEATVGPADEDNYDVLRSRKPAATEEGISQSTACSLCGVSYPTVHEQRQHVKSDFHRYNMKLQVKGVPPLNEATFARMIGDLDESISGSESDDSEEEDPIGKATTLSTLLKRQANLSHEANEETVTGPSAKTVSGNAPMYWFSSPKIGEDHVLGLYKAVFTHEEQDGAPGSLLDALKKRQLKPIYGKHSGSGQSSSQPTNADPHYFLCMIGGGHFAAMVVSLVPEIRRGPGGVEERHAVVRAHKTFHRYTTRRKQGGSQSANDNSKGNAHSVGSSIRRANEAALEVDIRTVLSEWRAMIDSADLIFIRATGSQNRRTLFGPYDDQVLYSKDKRLRGFPFSTRRATQAELLRSFQELSRLKVSTLADVTPEPVKPRTTAPKPIKPKTEPAKLSKEDEASQLHTSQLENLIRRSKAPGVLLYLTKNELSPDFRLFPPSSHHHAPTVLHLAASTNSTAIVSALLLKGKATPSVTNDDGKTPYDLAGDQRTRDAFRVARYQLGEDSVDWSASHVPGGISQEQADQRAAQEKVSNAAAEAERRNADLDRIRKEEELRTVNKMERKSGPGKSLAAAAEKSGSEKREEEMRGLTPEMRMRLERERRARAAEERIRKMQGGR
ncbi:uncharacterized protein HMPREF1541_04560 [Cyphellophora europaea CBS 101466]|uniref:VLRF1 domain-containing protein n=1 Tax=Cyphellophora europaea (strain CBS 101466) TaxID=1220924 RepID=W2RX55_CYPE1|nr:uncharacterized protein HMPREF1541_04560 [Cyphellophora europaea CBS 101466]ETN40284.1 hypothetical protein HMPREF1541_04560 [Cyphellophora europaea CBS 101466]